MSVKSTLFAAAVYGFLCVSATIAHADPVVVQVAGRDQATVHSDLIKAAEKACRSARNTDYFDDYGSQEECVDGSLQQAMATLDQADDSSSFRVAGNDTQDIRGR